MTEEIKRQLWEWAAAYHCAGFIQNDPVQFPHRYERKQDIEIIKNDGLQKFDQKSNAGVRKGVFPVLSL